VVLLVVRRPAREIAVVDLPALECSCTDTAAPGRLPVHGHGVSDNVTTLLLLRENVTLSGLELFAPGAGEQRSSPRVIRCRDSRLAQWLPVTVQEEGIRRNPGLRESILGHPGGLVSLGQALGAEALASVVNGKRAIEEGVDIDPCARVTASAWPGMHLEEAAVELHRVIVGDGALSLDM
jgi:hypothetical protein